MSHEPTRPARPGVYDPDRDCSMCGDPAGDHDAWGCLVASSILGHPDELIDCGCTWDGRSAGCDHHAPADQSCAVCLTLAYAAHQSLDLVRYEAECQACRDRIAAHCRSCLDDALRLHEGRTTHLAARVVRAETKG